MPGPEEAAGFQERGLRWLLLLSLLHSVPVIWITPVAAGTAPAAALLAFGLAGLVSFDAEGIALGLIALIPGLIYLALTWGLAWLLTRGLRHLRRAWRLVLTGLLLMVTLASGYFPIYMEGGHNASSSATLFELFAGYPQRWFVIYWVALHGLLGLLYALQFPEAASSWLGVFARRSRPAIRLAGAVLVVGIIYAEYPSLVCRPLAALGSNAAQLCVAETGGPQARYWYERAAADGSREAILWLLDNTQDRRRRADWLRRGAAAGIAEVQYRLAEHLRRDGDVDESETWLETAASGGYGPAQFDLAERLTSEVVRTQSPALLAQRNALMERAAANGSRRAVQRIAGHYARGSMGYPLDLGRAAAQYREIGDAAGLADIEQTRHSLAAADPAVLVPLAKRYLSSPLPGPGVRERGLELLQQAAARDPAARRELIVLLRTGADGVPKDLAAARRWLVAAAQDGEVAAMDRVVRNYMDGRDGFPVDYPEARRWIAALTATYENAGGDAARAHLAEQRNRLKYIARLENIAGGELLGPTQLQALERAGDAASRYRFGLQLLAGHGTDRHAEAVASLQRAAELGHAAAAWRLVEIYERGFFTARNPTAARRELERAVALHHFEATRELASRYEYGSKGYTQDLDRAIAMYEAALAAGHDNRYGWNLDPGVFNHFRWLESRLHQARLKRADAAAPAAL